MSYKTAVIKDSIVLSFVRRKAVKLSTNDKRRHAEVIMYAMCMFVYFLI